GHVRLTRARKGRFWHNVYAPQLAKVSEDVCHFATPCVSVHEGCVSVQRGDACQTGVTEPLIEPLNRTSDITSERGYALASPSRASGGEDPPLARPLKI